MILVIGNSNCPKCDMTKQLLQKKQIEFEYKLLNDLENKNEYIKNARSRGILSAPLIEKDNELISFDELIEYIKTI